MYAPRIQGFVHINQDEQLVNGRVMRVYKNLFPSLRSFWLWATKEHKDELCVVFEKQRFTFQQMLDMSVKWAAVFQDVYGVAKGVITSKP